MVINKRWSNFLFKEVSISPLIAFRIIIGILFLFSTVRFILNGWVKQLYIDPPFHFSYLGFDWVKPLAGNGMYLPFIAMIVASLGIIFGAFYRFSTSLFFLAFTYVELLDKSYYLNHYYFVSLIAFLLIWMPANAQFSLDAKRNPSIQRETIPQWPIFLLRFQLGIVYCFAGIAKLNADWLFEAQPLRLWLQAFRDLPLVGNLFATSWVAFGFSWFSCFYDLTIPFFLSKNKTRVVAYVFVVVFHVITWLLFPIGVFPWVMICSTLIFFPASFHDRWLNKLKNWFRWKSVSAKISSPASKTVFIFTSIFLIIQIILPFRYLLYPNGLFWHEEGFRFSWRVMLVEKKGYATFYVEDPKTRNSIEISNEDYLSPQQIDQMSRQPDMILQFAHFLGNKYADTTFHFGSKSVHLSRPRVTADVYVTLNGRPNQHFVGRETDLMKEHYNLKHRKWIIPLKN
ncbi:HTTM domain-containing protein [Fluviicola taffensis]|uniref:HTTM domain protein n=1 Tax=Fluviicola taffensis (strain DSM 16823 / NCIMB 13979 / RW262) TaxID=755732 RepID=F2IGX2_FLUTR|nr:HTTM domain-containing protein [Fluviicola taffensis]AEA44753.1 HTTM domain protein [Fluviicola taffensis DSM 16823]